jgi:hypothetical protein
METRKKRGNSKKSGKTINLKKVYNNNFTKFIVQQQCPTSLFLKSISFINFYTFLTRRENLNTFFCPSFTD